MADWRTGITVARMREVDRLMFEEYSVALLQMMENAGRSLAALTRILTSGNLAGARVAVLVGSGNNGGGGLAAARHLANAGADAHVALIASPPLPGETPERQRAALAAMGVPGSAAALSIGEVPTLLRESNIVIDALIGYSLRANPREPVAGWIRAANSVSAQRIALDLPSGLDGDTGEPGEPTVRVNATLTLAWPKAGLLTPAAQPFVGDLYLADISVPEAVYSAIGVHRGDLFARGPVVRLRVEHGKWRPDEEATQV